MSSRNIFANSLSDDQILQLRHLQDRGYGIVYSRHSSIPETVNIEGDLEVFVGLPLDSAEARRLADARIDVILN